MSARALLAALATTVALIALTASPSAAIYGPNGGAYHPERYCGSQIATAAVMYGGDGSQTSAEVYRSQNPGNYNSCVKHIQYMLNDGFCTSGTRLVLDGSYGPKTKAAVTALQRWARSVPLYVNNTVMKVDGYVGPQTWAILTEYWYNPRTRMSCA